MNKSELKAYVSTLFPDLSETSLESFIESATYLKCTKGTTLFSEGKRHNYFYFILNGSVKSHYLKDSKEVCLWFGFENDAIATIRTMEGQTSNETIELMEDSELIRIETQSIKALAQTNLEISQLIIQLITEHAEFLEVRLYQLQFMSSKERYDALIEVAPEVLQKVSLTDIASYLGVSRETLSRIRKK